MNNNNKPQASSSQWLATRPSEFIRNSYKKYITHLPEAFEIWIAQCGDYKTTAFDTASSDINLPMSLRNVVTFYQNTRRHIPLTVMFTSRSCVYLRNEHCDNGVTQSLTRKASCGEYATNTVWTLVLLPPLELYINKFQQDATVCKVFIYCRITLHVSGVHRTHHQEYIKLLLQPPVQVISRIWGTTFCQCCCSDTMTCTRGCSYNFMYSWWWVRWTPETCNFANKYLHTVASCWILLI